ncbi:MAG: NAD(P)H-hydrate epimerase [Lachnospiraceae bacterium]|nr:NAD(P)H-hydrate epimerase [Lachnospiraceae bacterium]
MPYCVSVATMRESDAWTIENKISSKELMGRAGTAIYEATSWKAPVAIVCGKGNNAGDGFVVANLLAEANIPVDIFLLSDSFSDDGKYYHDICEARSIRSIAFEEGMSFAEYGSVLDCIFGTGFSGEPRGIYGTAIDAINASGAYVVSADINSGLNGDTGLGTKYVKSDLTVSIGTFKPGHFLGLAKEAMKEKVNADIGIEIQGEYIWVEE